MQKLNQLSAQDAQFLFAETENNLGNVTGVQFYQPGAEVSEPYCLNDLTEQVRSRLNLSPVFTQKLQRVPLNLDFPYWVADRYFELEAHISSISLGEEVSWDDVCGVIGRFHSRPLNMQRPLWEILMVEGLGNLEGFASGSFALLSKFHHCAIDGISGTHVLTALTDIDEKGTPLYPIPKKPPAMSGPVSIGDIAANATHNNLSSPVRMAGAILEAAPMIYPALRRILAGGEERKSRIPPTRFNRATSPHKVFDGRAFPLDSLKKIRKLVDGATINDVVLTITSGAIRRYLQHHGELPPESLAAFAPVNLRPRTAGNDTQASGNNISAMNIHLFTQEKDALRRLARIQQVTSASKVGKRGISARLMADLSKHAPGFTLSMASKLLVRTSSIGKLANVLVSNIPGPQMPLYMNGYKMTHSYGMAPLANGLGLFVATPSYDGKIFFSITSTKEILPDAGLLMQCFQDSVDELLSRAVESTRKTTR